LNNFRETEICVVDGLQAWLEKKGYHCAVIAANQTSPIPPYPYIAYTVTSPVIANMKGYSVSEDGTRYKTLGQMWSFTVQSNDDEEASNIALEAYDWFALSGNTYLSDNGIVAQNVGNIMNRDNILTIEYEYRRGFDVELSLLHTISKADSEQAGYIETAEVTKI
jgi:hypothetical protein